MLRVDSISAYYHQMAQPWQPASATRLDSSRPATTSKRKASDIDAYWLADTKLDVDEAPQKRLRSAVLPWGSQAPGNSLEDTTCSTAKSGGGEDEDLQPGADAHDETNRQIVPLGKPVQRFKVCLPASDRWSWFDNLAKQPVRSHATAEAGNALARAPLNRTGYPPIIYVDRPLPPSCVITEVEDEAAPTSIVREIDTEDGFTRPQLSPSAMQLDAAYPAYSNENVLNGPVPSDTSTDMDTD